MDPAESPYPHQVFTYIIQAEARAGRTITLECLFDRVARLVDPEDAAAIAEGLKQSAVAN